MPRPVTDLRNAAKRRLPRLLFDYIDGGSYDEITLRRNRDDLKAIALRQRVMVDIGKLSMATTLLGQPMRMPLVLGPVGFAGMYARRGEVQAARAAHAAGIPICLSTLSICGLQEVTRDSGAAPWFQLYMVKDRGFCATLIERAKALGSPVLVLTVDLPIAGARYRDLRSGMSGPASLRGAAMRAWQGLTHPRWLWDVQLRGGPHRFGNIPPDVIGEGGLGAFAPWIKANFDPTVTWKELDWLRARWDGPILVKGLLDPEDARAALSAGVDAIAVSNHGGRQLDGVPSGISALPAMLDAIGGRVPVLVDGGIRSGLDILRALALGADACLVGRAWAYALGAAGQAGVAELLTTLRDELEVAMSLTGCVDVADAGSHLLVR